MTCWWSELLILLHSLAKKAASAFKWYLVYELVGKMEESHHSTPGDAVSKDVPSNIHEDIMSTVILNLVYQSEKEN